MKNLMAAELAALGRGQLTHPPSRNHGNAPSSWSEPRQCSIVVVRETEGARRSGTEEGVAVVPG